MGRPSSPITAEADAAQKALLAYMRRESLTKADVARRTGICSSTVGRVLSDRPAREVPALMQLHEQLVLGADVAHRRPTGPLLHALSDVDRTNAKTTAQILRAIADLLEQRHL